MDTATRDRWVGWQEAREYLGISRSAVYKLHEVHKLGSNRPGVGLRFRLSDLDRYMTDGTVPDAGGNAGPSRPGKRVACRDDDNEEVPGTGMTRGELRRKAGL